MKNLLFLLFSAPFFLLAQPKGVVFARNTSWQDILQKAKSENKYVFIDCYASWCGPCKRMDKEVYPNDSIGYAMNDKFISLKIQMDSTKADDAETKEWYSFAHATRMKYNIAAFPSFLFFSPDGTIIHKDLGFKDMKSFLEMLDEAVQPSKQYYTLLKSYQSGKMEYSQMTSLANKAKALKDDDIAYGIASNYIHNYMEKLPDDDLYKKDNFAFCSSFQKVISSKDKLFQILYHNGARVDSAMGYKTYADDFVSNVIYREEISPGLISGKETGKEPKWNEMSSVIKNKYSNHYVDNNILVAKIDYFKYMRQWKEYSRYLVLLVDSYAGKEIPPGFGSIMYFNNKAFEVFKYSDDKQELRKALAWVDQLLDKNASIPPTVIDTKANLLYKLGKKQEGVSLEEKALALSPKDKSFQETLDKMKDGAPTWPTN